MKVIAYDLYPNQEAAKSLCFTYTSLEEIYKTSDVISTSLSSLSRDKVPH